MLWAREALIGLSSAGIISMREKKGIGSPSEAVAGLVFLLIFVYNVGCEIAWRASHEGVSVSAGNFI